MARISTYLSNTHPDGRVCGLCHEPIVTGQGAYVRTDGKGANHVICPAAAMTGAARLRTTTE